MQILFSHLLSFFIEETFDFMNVFSRIWLSFQYILVSLFRKIPTIEWSILDRYLEQTYIGLASRRVSQFLCVSRYENMRRGSPRGKYGARTGFPIKTFLDERTNSPLH